MSRKIYCLKLKKEAEGLDRLPFPGELGQKIYDHVSKEAWILWVSHQTKLINEYRLNLMEPKARIFLTEEMEKFLWGEGSENPPGFLAQT